MVLGATLAAVVLALVVASALAVPAAAAMPAPAVAVSPSVSPSPSGSPVSPSDGTRTGGSPAAPDRGKPGWVWFGIAALVLGVFGAGGFRIWRHRESDVPERDPQD